jgi:hypothetical protein
VGNLAENVTADEHERELAERALRLEELELELAASRAANLALAREVDRLRELAETFGAFGRR